MRALESPQRANSVALDLLMETQHKLEIAARVRELRSRSPFTQANIADKLGITLRAYQAMEAKGTTKWERCEELAKIYDTTPEFIWDGTDKKPTPDLLGSLDGNVSDRLDRIEEKLDEVLEWIATGESVEDAVDADQRSAPAVPQSETAQTSTGTQETGH